MLSTEVSCRQSTDRPHFATFATLSGNDAISIYPFGLIYQIRVDEILITSVMDLRLDPKSWKDLL